MKRTTSVFDQDYDLMGLSRNNAENDDSFPQFDHGNGLAQFDDLNVDLVKKEGPKMPFNEGLDDLCQIQEPLLLENKFVEGAF